MGKKNTHKLPRLINTELHLLPRLPHKNDTASGDDHAKQPNRIHTAGNGVYDVTHHTFPGTLA